MRTGCAPLCCRPQPTRRRHRKRERKRVFFITNLVIYTYIHGRNPFIPYKYTEVKGKSEKIFISEKNDECAEKCELFSASLDK
jgi:hypothetical protein